MSVEEKLNQAKGSIKEGVGKAISDEKMEKEAYMDAGNDAGSSGTALSVCLRQQAVQYGSHG